MDSRLLEEEKGDPICGFGINGEPGDIPGRSGCSPTIQGHSQIPALFVVGSKMVLNSEFL